MARFGYQGHIGRVGGGGNMRSLAASQGGARAQYSGTTSFIRHATSNTFDLATGKAHAIPLVCFNTSDKRGTVSANPLGSSKNQSPYACFGSRVDNISINLTIQQTDTSKVNEVYSSIISTSFTEAALNDTFMEDYFNDMITMDTTTTTNSNSAVAGATDSSTIKYESNAWSNGSPQSMTYQKWMLTPQLKHSMPIMRKYSLYSGRVATAKTIAKIPPKNRRAQMGSGYWLVIMHDSPDDSTADIKIHLDTFFKEIPATEQISVS